MPWDSTGQEEVYSFIFFFFQPEDGIRDLTVTGVQTCALPISGAGAAEGAAILHHFALKINAFATLGTDDAGAFEAGQVFRLDFDFDPLRVEENFVGELRVGF